MKFATKLLLALTGTVGVGAVVLVLIADDRTARLFEVQIEARLEENARHLIDRLDRHFNEHLREARELAGDPAFVAATGSPEQTGRNLKEFLRWHPEYPSAAFLSMDRVRVIDTAGSAVGARDEAAHCWSDLAAGQDVAVCVQRSSPGGGPTLVLALVARDGRGARGVVFLRLPLRVLDELMDAGPGSRGAAEGLHVDLVDRQGVFLYSNYVREGILREVSPDWEAIQGLIGSGRSSGTLRYTNPAEETGEEILVFVRQQGFRDNPGSGWTLNLFVPMRTAFAPVRELRLAIAATILASSSLLLAALFLLVRSFTRPIEELGRAARAIGRGELEVRVPVGSRDELGQFAVIFNRMATDMQESRRRLAAASGELEAKVEERTVALERTNGLLHAELSERVKTQKALQLSEQLYRDLFDESTDGIYQTDAQGVFTKINRAGARLFGYDNPTQILGLPALDFWRDPVDRAAFRKELTLKKSVSSYPVRAKKKSGEFLELENSSRILEGADGAFLGIEGMLRDVTQRMKSEAERELLIAQLQEAAANIKALSGLLPICAGCKKIRDDQGAWSHIETYISAHSEAEFTHGLCPECQKIYFPGATGRGPAASG